MSARKKGRPAAPRKPAKKTMRTTKPGHPPVKLSELLGKFSEARALLECGMQSVEDDEMGPWCVAIERAQRDLREVYNTLDMIALRFGEWEDEDEEEEEEES